MKEQKKKSAPEVQNASGASKKDMIKFIVLGLIGIFLYFIPLGDNGVPVVKIVGFIKTVLGDNLKYIVLIALALLMVSIAGARIFKKAFCEKLHKGEKLTKTIHYVVAFIVVIFVWFKLPPAMIFSDERIGGTILNLAGTVMLTVSICGWFVVFILKSGIVEFFGTLFEPLMRPLFRLPGEASVNYISSYVVSAAVGVYITDQYYENKIYTRKEAMVAATSFATISVGYVGVLCSIGKIENMYGTLLGITFGLVFLMTIIMVRIPPLSKVADTYIDGKVREKKEGVTHRGESRFSRAVNSAALKSREFTAKEFFISLGNSLKFAQRIIAYMIPIVIVTLSIVYYTPFFKWLGYPVTPLLDLLGLADAAKIAPAVFLGFVEITLPAISVSTGVVTASVFFVVQLSIIQIIFMTEAGNAMLGSKSNIGFPRLIAVFVIRTIIAIPIVAIITHLLF